MENFNKNNFEEKQANIISSKINFLPEKSIDIDKELNEKFPTSFLNRQISNTCTYLNNLEKRHPNIKRLGLKKAVLTAIIASQFISPTPLSAKNPDYSDHTYLKQNTNISSNEYIPKDFPGQQEIFNNTHQNNLKININNKLEIVHYSNNSSSNAMSFYESFKDTKTGENIIKINYNPDNSHATNITEQNYDQYNQNIDQFSQKIVEVQINCSYGDYIKNIIIQKLNDLGYKIINGSKTNPNIPTLIVTNTPINNSGNLGVNTQFNNVGINYNSGSSYTNTLYFYYSYKDQKTGENLIQIIGSSEGNSSNWNVGTYAWLQNFGINVNLCNNDPALKATQEAANNLNSGILAAIPATTFNNPSSTSYQTNNTNQYPSQQYSTQYSNYAPNNTSTVENQTISTREININNGFDPYLNNTDILYSDYAGWTEIILLDKNGKAQETIKKSFQATPQSPFNIMEIVNQEFKEELEKTSYCNFKIKFYLTNSTNPYSSNYVSIKKTK